MSRPAVIVSWFLALARGQGRAVLDDVTADLESPPRLNSTPSLSGPRDSEPSPASEGGTVTACGVAATLLTAPDSIVKLAVDVERSTVGCAVLLLLSLTDVLVASDISAKGGEGGMGDEKM